MTEQRLLLGKLSTRKVLQRVRNDSVSLLVHRDTNSLASRITDKLSTLSIVFFFDQELFITKVYERVFWGSLKETMRRQQHDPEARERLKTINRYSWRDRGDPRNLKPFYRILVLSDCQNEKKDLMEVLSMNLITWSYTGLRFITMPSTVQNFLSKLWTNSMYSQNGSLTKRTATPCYISLSLRTLRSRLNSGSVKL